MANDRSVPVASAAISDVAPPDSQSLCHQPLFVCRLAWESCEEGNVGMKRTKTIENQVFSVPLLTEQFVIPYTAILKQNV